MELIVVIVILAILAAILIPGLLKWIDEAKNKKYELEAREVSLAAEAALVKMYAEGGADIRISKREGENLYEFEKGVWITIGERWVPTNDDKYGYTDSVKELTDLNVIKVTFRPLLSEDEENSLPSNEFGIPWEGTPIEVYELCFVSSDGTKIRARYDSDSGFAITNITKNPDEKVWPWN